MCPRWVLSEKCAPFCANIYFKRNYCHFRHRFRSLIDFRSTLPSLPFGEQRWWWWQQFVDVFEHWKIIDSVFAR
jgi:hypothetical protein